MDEDERRLHKQQLMLYNLSGRPTEILRDALRYPNRAPIPVKSLPDRNSSRGKYVSIISRRLLRSEEMK